MKSLFEQFGGTYHNESDYLMEILHFLRAKKAILVFMDNSI